jgi:hypothetical protein
MTAQQTARDATMRDLLGRFFGVPFRTQTYRNLAYLALAFPLGLLYFVGAAIGFGLGAGLLITWVGLPILLVTVAGATVVAGFEAALARRLVGADAAVPEILRDVDPADAPLPGDGFVAAVKRLLTAPSTWTSVLLVPVRFGFGIVSFTALVTAGTLAPTMLAAPVLYDDPHTTLHVGWTVVDTFPGALAVAGAGLLLTVVALHLLNALARLGATLTAAALDVGAETPH